MNAIPPPLPQAPRRTRCVAAWILVLLLALLLIGSLAVNATLSKALTKKLPRATKTHSHAVDEFPDLTEVWAYGEGDTKAVRIAVEGIIMREVSGGLFSTPQNMVDSVLAQIRAAQADDDVKAIIVDVDSPGGGITASDEIYRALMTFRSSAEGRVVIIFMHDLAASGGYYIAMASDWIIAQPTTVVGSIGVIMQSINMKGLSEKIGITDVTIKSGANKDLLNPFSEVDPAQRQLLQEMINSMYEHFLGIVQESRQIPMEELRPIADGRIFVADQALALDLVDQIGYWEDVTEKTKELLGVDTVKIIRYEQPVDFVKWLMNIRSPIQPASWLNQYRSRFLYLWQP